MYALSNESDGFQTKMIDKFPELFSGKIGKLKDFELKFHINRNVKPCVQKERKIPFHLKEKVEKAIDDMINYDLI